MGQQTGDKSDTIPDWRNLGPCEALEEKGRILVKLDGLQVAVFQTSKGVFAVNNRCPHEGFPLMEGTLNDNCSLACNWHGWTFDLESGKAIEGRDAVKTYPLEKRGRDLWVDIAQEPAPLRRKAAMAELIEALSEHDYDRIARSLARLEKAETSLEDVARIVINWSVSKLERGFGHAHAGLADWMALADVEADRRHVAILEAAGHFSWDALFSPSLELPTDPKPWSESCYIADLEGMNSLSAMARVKGAFATGQGFSAIKPAMRRFIFQHYMGFGHPAIYLMKLDALIHRLGDSVAEPLILQLTKYLCVASREDLIPEFRSFADCIMLDPGTTSVPAPENFSGQSVRKAMLLTAASTHHHIALFDSLVGAAALNMLRFDQQFQDAVEQPIARNIGWLDFTHAITFAEALDWHGRENPAVWQSGLMQLACFVGRNASYLQEADMEKWQLDDPDAFLAAEKTKLFNMDEGEYIYGVHRLKMVVAVEKLAPKLTETTRHLVFAALHRYLRSRLRQRHPARTAFQARETVVRAG